MPRRSMPRNRLLAALSTSLGDLIGTHLTLLTLSSRQTISPPNEPLTDVYFPLSGVASMLSIMQDGRSVEVASIGNEGMVGTPLLLGR